MYLRRLAVVVWGGQRGREEPFQIPAWCRLLYRGQCGCCRGHNLAAWVALTRVSAGVTFFTWGGLSHWRHGLWQLRVWRQQLTYSRRQTRTIEQPYYYYKLYKWSRNVITTLALISKSPLVHKLKLCFSKVRHLYFLHKLLFYWGFITSHLSIGYFKFVFHNFNLKAHINID